MIFYEFEEGVHRMAGTWGVDRGAQLDFKDSLDVDLVVGIARGGIPISLVVADRLRVPVDFINMTSSPD